MANVSSKEFECFVPERGVKENLSIIALDQRIMLNAVV